VSSYVIPSAELEVAERACHAIICVRRKCGCSSVVEHLLAKEDVASSSLVTRSSLESIRGRHASGGRQQIGLKF
jgi:hypothetical protein